MKFTYLLVNFFTIIIPFLFSFHPRLRFDRHFKPFFIGSSITAFCFLLWDALFTYLGVWGFNDKYIIGIKMYNLPMEEILFFFCIPFACVFTYHCLNKFYSIKWGERTERWATLLLALLLLTAGTIYIDRLYTSSTFISTSILLLLLKFVFRVKWLPKFLGIYPILLIPFFIVNGLLTGTGLQEPVVGYNNSENLGIRLLTIPAEDIFYGLEMLLLNLFFYEKLKDSFAINKS